MKTKIALLAFGLAAFLPVAALAQSTGGTACYDLYQPVCGAQQVECFAAPCYPVYHTYSNSCFLSAQNGTYIHDGACTDTETGPIKPQAPYVPPKGCIAYFDGCNSCSVQNGRTMCTLRACQIGSTAKGYCSAYQKPVTTTTTTTTVTNPPAPASTSATTSGTTTTSTTPVHVGFFATIWAAVLRFFSWF